MNISSRIDGQLPNYAIENKSSMGSSVFFETMKNFNYQVGRSLKPIYSEDTNSVQIVMQSGNFDINNSKIKNWVRNGGTLIYLVPNNLGVVAYGKIPEVKGSIKLYKYINGMVITADSNDILNSALTKNTDNAYNLLMEIDKYSNKQIYFNENHLYSDSSNASLWGYIPISIKLILYQLFITLAAFIYFKGKRFGKIVPYSDEGERIENEYLYSAAALYREARCWDLMLENYYRNFLSEIRCSEDEWLEYWEKEKLSHYNKAKKSYTFMHSSSKKMDSKDYVEIVNLFDELSIIVKERRDLYWKTLKKTI